MKFNIGDKVSFLNEKGGGVVIDIINSHRVLIINEDGFEVSVSIENIVAMTGKSDYQTNLNMNQKWLNEKEDHEIKPPSQLSENELWEIDLHLHELIDTSQHKSDYEKLMFQLNYFKKCMNAVMSHGIKKVIFIHGVGKGTLKQEIIHALRDYDCVRYYDASIKKYGYGALTVEIC